MNISGRNFFFLAAGALLQPDDRLKRDMLARSVRSPDLEMPLSGFSDYITPIEHFFVEQFRVNVTAACHSMPASRESPLRISGFPTNSWAVRPWWFEAGASASTPTHFATDPNLWPQCLGQTAARQ